MFLHPVRFLTFVVRYSFIHCFSVRVSCFMFSCIRSFPPVLLPSSFHPLNLSVLFFRVLFIFLNRIEFCYLFSRNFPIFFVRLCLLFSLGFAIFQHSLFIIHNSYFYSSNFLLHFPRSVSSPFPFVRVFIDPFFFPSQLSKCNSL